jgi:hypothetical protein
VMNDCVIDKPLNMAESARNNDLRFLSGMHAHHRGGPAAAGIGDVVNVTSIWVALALLCFALLFATVMGA